MSPKTANLPTVALAALALSALPSAHAAGLDDLLHCRDDASLALPLSEVMALAQADGFQCRQIERRHGASASCSSTGRATAFGRRIKEFTLADDERGGRLLSIAFTEPPARLQPLIERARTQSGTGSPLLAGRVGQREDGVAELLCSRPASQDGSGSIAGNLAFRGMQPLPAMRVCAAPIDSVEAPQCMQTPAGASRYQIDGLAPGDYYVTAYPLRDNPHRLIAAYARPVGGCRTATCPERLQAVPVSAGQVRDGIDPLSLLPELPAALRAGATASR